jgi:predicted AAA+ superfamily ATPase
MEKTYLTRLVDDKLKTAMDALGGVYIEGLKWCGKSTTAERLAKTIVKLQDPIVYERYAAFATTSRELLLAGEKPLMFDEWQNIPKIWDFIRAAIDEHSLVGQYILTGSAKPKEDTKKKDEQVKVKRHTGTGRIAKITMYPMSLWESRDSSGEVSLSDIFDGKDVINGTSKLTLEQLAFVICRGGFPESVVRPNQALTLIAYYYMSLTTEDITDVDGINRNPKRAHAILRSYARHISTVANSTTIMADIEANDKSITKPTFNSYISAFEKLFVICDIDAWSPQLRSKTAIRVSAKRQFVDPSLAAHALGVRPNDLIADLKTFGFLFESLCERDLKVYSQSLDGEISHYHDESGLKTDAIIHLADGRWGAIEIKLGGNQINVAAAKLIKLKEKVAERKEPSFLMVLTGSPYAYKRPDGVLVVPIGCLKN